ISAASLLINERTIAITAAIPMTKVEYTLVMASTPIFSPYVVLGVEPTKLEIIVETPFPIKERPSPESFVRSFPTILLVTKRCPICSGTSTKAAGRIMRIQDQSNLIAYSSGIPIQEASSTDDKSKIPKLHAMIYPAMIPNNIGMILRKPRNVTQKTIVIINVNAATLASVTLMDPSAGASASGIQPAISAAVGTSSNPITAIIAPMAAGGKMTSIQLVPTRRINSPISVNTIPTARNPPKA